MRDDAVDPLTPIREFEENEDINIMNTQGKTSRTSNEHVKSYISLMRSQKKTEKGGKGLFRVLVDRLRRNTSVSVAVFVSLHVSVLFKVR